MVVRDWLEDQENPDNLEMLSDIEKALYLLSNVYHSLREDL
jgi:hypothetical protein